MSSMQELVDKLLGATVQGFKEAATEREMFDRMTPEEQQLWLEDRRLERERHERKVMENDPNWCRSCGHRFH